MYVSISAEYHSSHCFEILSSPWHHPKFSKYPDSLVLFRFKWWHMRARLILLLLRLRKRCHIELEFFSLRLYMCGKWRVIMWKGWEEKGKGSKSKLKYFSYLVVTWVENKGYKIVSYDSKYYISIYIRIIIIYFFIKRWNFFIYL
jgi:hypothetical protein